jgi:hypothetical protein
MALSFPIPIYGFLGLATMTLFIIGPQGRHDRTGPTAARAADAPAPSEVSAAGITLRSVSVTLPTGDRMFPGGAPAEAINNNCVTCHSAGMVLTQPSLTRADWQGEVNKMRNVYKAPIADGDVAAIVDYLVHTKGL